MPVNVKTSLFSPGPADVPPLIPVPYPAPAFRIRSSGGLRQIFDPVRRRFVALTPEEWVRQNFMLYLQTVLGYPAALMAVEKEIRLGELRRRCDIVLYRASRPWLIVECKEPSVPVDEKALRQIAAYQLALRVDYLVLTNGAHTLGWDNQAGAWLRALPAYGGADEASS